MAGIRDIRKAKAAAMQAVKDWKAANPRKQGESLAAYRKRAKAGIEAALTNQYGGADWSGFLQIVMEFLKVLLPLLIV